MPEFFAVKCDVHPWMRAWVGVFDHPWFAVTSADGAFRLANVAPGSYTLIAWQERFGELSREVRVDADRPVTINFEFAR